MPNTSSNGKQQWFAVDDYDLAQVIAEEVIASGQRARVTDRKTGMVVYGEEPGHNLLRAIGWRRAANDLRE